MKKEAFLPCQTPKNPLFWVFPVENGVILGGTPPYPPLFPYMGVKIPPLPPLQKGVLTGFPSRKGGGTPPFPSRKRGFSAWFWGGWGGYFNPLLTPQKGGEGGCSTKQYIISSFFCLRFQCRWGGTCKKRRVPGTFFTTFGVKKYPSFGRGDENFIFFQKKSLVGRPPPPTPPFLGFGGV